MVTRLWRYFVRWLRSIFKKKRTRVKSPRLSDREYQRLFAELIAGVGDGWNRGEVLQHLGNQINSRFFRDWLRRYGRELRGLSDADYRLARRLVQLSQLGCGEFGEFAGDIGRDLLLKPMREDVEETKTLPPETSSPSDTPIPIDNGDSDEAQVWFNRGIQQYISGDFLGAIASWDKAIQIKPDYHQAWDIRGFPLENLGRLEDAVASYDRAIQIQPDFHEAWNSRGFALSKLGRLEDAVASYDRAIQFKPDFHEAWNSRGFALSDLGRLEDAVASYDRAIQIQPDLHDAWNNRGYALSNLGRLEEAVVSYDRAIHIQPDDHVAWHNRGGDLYDLGRLEEAVASYDRAIQIKPDDHVAWNNRGSALYDLGRLEEAVASYDRAIQIKPDDHVAWNNRGSALSDLGRLEEAVASCDRAIKIKPDDHVAWHNRGIAAVNSRHYNPESAILLQLQFPTLPLILPDPTLTQRGYEGALLSYETGLKHCPQDTHPEGWGRLHQYIGEAHYFQGKEKPNYREYWHKAVAEYKLSLITLTPEAYPEFHLQVLQDLLRVLWGLGKETEAKEWRRKGLDVFGKLLNRPMSRYQEWELQAKFITFSRMRVDVLVKEGDLIRALEAAERDKNFYLAWILDGQKGDIRSPNYEDMRQLTNPQTAIVYWHVSDFALTTFIIKHGMREPIVIESLSNSSSSIPKSGVGAKHLGDKLLEKPEDNNPNASPWINSVGDKLLEKPEDNLQTQNRQGEAFADKNPGLPDKLIAQMLHPYNEEKQHPSPENRNKLQAWVNQWDKLYGNYTKQKKEQDTAWRDNLPEILVKLGEILNIPAILEQLKEESIKNLIFIPHRDLHRFPLHALFPDRFVISYLPSVQIGINLWRGSLAADGLSVGGDMGSSLTADGLSVGGDMGRKIDNSSVTSVTKSVAKSVTKSVATSVAKSVTKSVATSVTSVTTSVAKLLTIEYPNSEGFHNLPFAEIEAAAITQLFPNHQRIAGENATKTAVTAALTKNHDIFHFTGHGNYNSDRPQNSALFLNGKDTLTLTDICTIPNLSNYKLVTLAACETAITGKEGIEKDYVGLASAFLYQGVASVLSTLWTIPEEGSSLFTIYFYWQLRHGKEPAIALKITQKWLRTLTYSKLERYYQIIFAKLPKEEKPLRPHLRNELWQISKMDISQKNEQPFNHPYYWAAFTLTGKTQPSQ